MPLPPPLKRASDSTLNILLCTLIDYYRSTINNVFLIKLILIITFNNSICDNYTYYN